VTRGELPLSGRNALVVGANGLIGAAIASRLALGGARTTIAARDGAALREQAESLTGRGAQVVVHPLDVTDDDAVAAAVAAAAEPGGLHVAVNNAGTAHLPTPLAELDLAEFDRVIAVSLRGVAVAMKHELARAAAGAAIVNITSSAGTGGAPGMSAYSAAKHGVVGLTRTAAIDYAGRGIRVNAVAPGPIRSGKVLDQPADVLDRIGRYVPLGRMGTADEVAEAAFWLASAASSYVTGIVLAVDGGKSA
jgi:NAD(P)-dependent dehydrogenase (short-subunit alcohol dehydrogenase family)